MNRSTSILVSGLILVFLVPATVRAHFPPGIDVHLFGANGKENGNAETDPDLLVSFTDNQVNFGLNAIVLGLNQNEAGKLSETALKSRSQYLTMTCFDPESSPCDESSAETSRALPNLPAELTSFGAARLGDCLFVYGGHTGDAHSYSTAEQSKQLLRLDLDRLDTGWQIVSTGPRLQGLGMVAHGNRLIMLGGFTANNAAGEPQDLHSQASTLVYDTVQNAWSELPALPEPRSSHDAALIDDTLYVVGGWNMQGEQETVWHHTAWAMDLSLANPRWTKIAEPPFIRRALALVANRGKLYAIGGMNENSGPTKAVSVFDPVTNVWSAGPELIGKGAMAGFGASGWTTGRGLVITTYEGDIQALDNTAEAWQVLGKSKTARFFHRMLPLNDTRLVAIGGANMEEGKFLELETIDIPSPNH